MAANIEIKAKVRDPDQFRELVAGLAGPPREAMVQTDIFYQTVRGRLKLRKLSPEVGQLIFYERRDGAGPKRSDYVISTTHEPDTLSAVLRSCLGVRGEVRKRRTLHQVGSTRIHLDDVDELGCFVELEVVLSPDLTSEKGMAVAAEWMERLGIQGQDLVDVAYIDLLEGQGTLSPQGRGQAVVSGIDRCIGNAQSPG